jgi:hypothetical protein
MPEAAEGGNSEAKFGFSLGPDPLPGYGPVPMIAGTLVSVALCLQAPAEASISRLLQRQTLEPAIDLAPGSSLPSALLPPGCERLSIADLQDGHDGWVTARLSGEVPEAGSGVLVWRGDAEGLSGFLQGDDGRRWRIVALENGDARLEFVDADRLPRCADLPAPPDLAPPARAELVACDDGKPIDVLVLYTPAARAQAGSKTAIEGQIAAAIGAANSAYGNSGIGARLNLLLQMEADYTSSDFGTDLWRLASPADGFLDWAHQLRDTAGADMVALIRNDGEYCGIAYLMYSNGPESEGIPFSVTAYSCLSNQTLAHELGHNMGCCHAVGDGGGCTGGGIWPWSVGWRFNGASGTQFRTVMAYAPGARIDHFSNPAVKYDNRATGVAIGQSNQADNAATINATAPTITNFRCSRGAIVQADCDANGNLDVLDVALGAGSDCDSDGRLDQCTASTITPCGTPAARAFAPSGLVFSQRNPQVATLDFAGSAVDATTDLAAIGIPGDDDRGSFSGKVLVMERSADAWVPAATLHSPTPVNAGQFGDAIAIDRDLIAIGEPGAVVGTQVIGRVHVFRRETAGWALLQTIECPEPTVGDLFGDRVASSNGVLVVGARGHRANGLAGAGGVFVFRRGNAGYEFIQKITATTPQAQALFGVALSMDAQRIIVGSSYETVNQASFGAVYVFVSSGGGWTLETRLQGPDAGARFGSSVAVSDAWIGVGAPSDTLSGYEAGALHMFRRISDTWVQQSSIRPAVGSQRQRIGYAVAIDGSRMIVSNKPDSSATGSSELWLLADGSWARQGTVYSGNAPSIRTDRAIVGAPTADEGATDSGAARIVMWNSDCNANGIPDRCDIDAGSESDVNGDGVPDSCGGIVYDLDGSGVIDFGDVSLLLLDAGPCPAPCPGDLSGDGVIDSADIALLLLQFG